MPLSDVVNFRFDVFTETYSEETITSEAHVIPANSPYYVRLTEIPKNDSPSSVTVYDVAAAANMTEVSGTPGDDEFRVDYKYQSDRIQFNAADAGRSIQVSYKGIGSRTKAALWNDRFDLYKAHNHDETNEDQKITRYDTLLRTGGKGVQSTSSVFPTYITLLTFGKVYIPPGTALLSVYLPIKLTAPGGTTGYVRVKVGSDAGTYVWTTSGSYSWKLATLADPDTGWQDIIIEACNSTGSQSIYVDGDAVSNMYVNN